MADDLHTELTEMMGPIQWEWLKPHVQRDAVVIVKEQLNMADVWVAIAQNKTLSFERWINEQLIIKPNAEQLTIWSSENKQFLSLIVQPYVLIQDKATADTSSSAPSPDSPI